MTDKNLRELLTDLHDELQRAQSVDEKGRALLRELDADIRDLLQRSGEAEVKTDESIRQRFQSVVDHFEVTHPALTRALSEMMAVLSNAGI